MAAYTPRYEGTRLQIVYGERGGIAGFALEELVRHVQDDLLYLIEVQAAQEVDLPGIRDNCLLVGTPQENRWVASFVEQGRIALPPDAEGFTIKSFENPWHAGRLMVVISGQTPVGVLRGVETFNCRIWRAWEPGAPSLYNPGCLPGAALQDEEGASHLKFTSYLTMSEAPAITERGLWTWGYVVYDYRRFLDNMARLKLNCLTIWNDVPPVNCADIIAYAHERGVRLILGFPWGWGMDYDLADPADRLKIQAQVLDHYQRYIAPLQPDGIYFQTLTEHHATHLAGRSTAAWAGELVNQVASQLYEITPRLDIRFGLHATSIGEHYTDLAGLDPRVTIVWEDAGALPFSYDPVLELNEVSFEQTLDYARRLAAFRPGSTFAMVAKGWTTLDWQNEFEHHGAYLMGIRKPGFTRQRLEQKQARWDRVNAAWQQYAPQAQAFYRALLEASRGRMSVLGLVEDGLFEERIQPSVARLAEMLWDLRATAGQVEQRANSPFYSGELA